MKGDLELLTQWQGGHASAGNELFQRHFAAVHRFFVNKVDQEAEDLVQMTFTRMVEARDRFAGHASFRTYLFAIAHNVLREYFRKRRRVDPATFDSRSVFDLGSGLSSIVAKRAEQQQLLDGLRRIPLSFQTLLELYYWEELSGSELAVIFGLPENTIRSRIRRGRELLSELVGRRPIEPRDDDAPQPFDTWASEVRLQLMAISRQR